MKENAAAKKVKVVKEVKDTEKKERKQREIAVPPSVPIDKKRFRLLIEHTGVDLDTVANCWGCSKLAATTKVQKGLLKPGEAFILAALCYLPLEMKKMLAVKVASLGKPGKAVVQFVDDSDSDAEETEEAPDESEDEDEDDYADA